MSMPRVPTEAEVAELISTTNHPIARGLAFERDMLRAEVSKQAEQYRETIESMKFLLARYMQIAHIVAGECWDPEKEPPVEEARNLIAKAERESASLPERHDAALAEQYRELREAAMQAYGALVGSSAAPDSVQGSAKARLKIALGFEKSTYERIERQMGVDEGRVALAAQSLKHGNDFPYDAPDSWVESEDATEPPPPTPIDKAHAAARGIISDLKDRRGIKDGFNGVDEKTRKGIVERAAEIIRQAMAQ